MRAEVEPDAEAGAHRGPRFRVCVANGLRR